MSIVNQIDVNENAYDLKSKNPLASEISVTDTKGIVSGAGEIVTEQQLFDAVAEQASQQQNFFEGVLPAGQTSLSINCDSSLTEDSMLDIYTNKYGATPKTIDVLVAQHQITMTFKVQNTDLKVAVRILKDKGGV